MSGLAIFFLVLGCMLLLILVLLSLLSYKIYSSVWMTRTFEILNPVKICFDDIKDNVERTPITFTLKKKVMELDKSIQGYIYSPKNKESLKHEIIILSPGYGKTHLSYLADIGMLTSFGYQVIAYDQYGTGMSGGRYQRGIHFGKATLDSVISEVEESEAFHGHDIYLYGHSWGGYSVLSVLDLHPEIKKVVARSPAGKPILSSYAVLSKSIGHFQAMCLYVAVLPVLFLRFGPQVFESSQKAALRCEKTKILITSCKDDPMISKKASPIDSLTKANKANIKIRIREDISIHNDLLTLEGWNYYIEKETEFNDLLKTKFRNYETDIRNFIGEIDRKRIEIDEDEAKAIQSFLGQ